MTRRIAYMPLGTYPEAACDDAVLGTVRLAATLGWSLHTTAFAVEIPPVSPPFGGFLINVEGMARAAEERSKKECDRLVSLVGAAAPAEVNLQSSVQSTKVGTEGDGAAVEARYFDLTLLPWTPDSASTQDFAQAVVFAAGRPCILVPASASTGPVQHLAIAWDESAVAARALCDALPLMAPGGTVSVLTVRDEKGLTGTALAQTLAASLALRGYKAEAVDITLNGRQIAVALQEEALSRGAQILAMGAFGHSRLRDFILGGATKGVFKDLRLQVLVSH